MAGTDLEKAVAEIDAQFGEGSIFQLGTKDTVRIESISTGVPALDVALGIGGVPRGRMVEIFGPESSGKTTLVYHIIAESQRAGGTCAFVDTEHALDPEYAGSIGVTTDDLFVAQPSYAEEALEITDRLVQTGEVSVVAIDSVAALVPRIELEGEMGEQTVGLLARLMSQAMRKLAGHVHKSNAVVVFTNQLRANINTLGYGPNETTTGGRALKFYASQRIDVRRIETLKKGTDDPTGNRVRAKVVKNKLAAPHRTAEFEIEYGKGVSLAAGLLDQGLANGAIKRSGAWYKIGDKQLGQGREAAKEALTIPENADIVMSHEAE